jgi:protease IV
MRTPARVALVLIVLFVLFLAVLGGSWWILKRGGVKPVPERTVLEVDFNRELIDYVPDNPVASFLSEKKMSMLGMIEALEAAATDDRVVGMVARVSSPAVGIAHIQELRDAIKAFRAAGKPAVAYADTFGEFVGGNGAYYLATAFDEIYLQPSGDVGLTGLGAVSPFIRGTLDKLGVEPEFGQRYEYKNAVNFFTEKEFTAAHKEALEALVDSVFNQLVTGIAEGRGLTEEAVRELTDQGPLLGEQAVAAHLVDGLKYKDEVYDQVLDQAGEGAKLLLVDRYAERVDGPYAEGDTIALVYGIGAVERGDSDFDPLSGSLTLGGDTVAEAIRKAAEDDDVKAILFRVDSPGGSYVASDTVWHEVKKASDAGKPVIVSMGDVAGSGGYFVAMSADKIVAEPSTITGSIGVFSGKFVTTDMWAKIGVTFDRLQTSDNALMYASTQPFTEAQWAKMNAQLDRVYEDFTTKVAEGRGLPLDKVKEIARGRIWSGEDGKRLGLVDELGGFRVALDLARAAAGLAPDAKVRLQQFPPPKSPFEVLFGKGGESSRDEAARAAVARVLTAVQPLARLARRAGLLGPEPGVLTMPAVEVSR